MAYNSVSGNVERALHDLAQEAVRERVEPRDLVYHLYLAWRYEMEEQKSISENQWMAVLKEGSDG